MWEIVCSNNKETSIKLLIDFIDWDVYKELWEPILFDNDFLIYLLDWKAVSFIWYNIKKHNCKIEYVYTLKNYRWKWYFNSIFDIFIWKVKYRWVNKINLVSTITAKKIYLNKWFIISKEFKNYFYMYKII